MTKAWFRNGTKSCVEPATQKDTWAMEAYEYPARNEALALRDLMCAGTRGFSSKKYLRMVLSTSNSTQGGKFAKPKG